MTPAPDQMPPAAKRAVALRCPYHLGLLGRVRQRTDTLPSAVHRGVHLIDGVRIRGMIRI